MEDTRIRLVSFSVSGFKTFRRSGQVRLGDTTLLLGGNGSGKSNLILFIKLLRSLANGTLSRFVAENGGAGNILHYGTGETTRIEVGLATRRADEEERRAFSLVPDGGNALALERGQDAIAGFSRAFLASIRVYHVANTGPLAPVRAPSAIAAHGPLEEDGANLAGVLMGLRDGGPATRAALENIQEHLRLCIPKFEGFVLEPEGGQVPLRWREKGTAYTMAAGQASDGVLRLMTLVTALLQPAATMPPMVLLDEPELGLHPNAIPVLAALVRKAGSRSQVVVATQSVDLVSEFGVEEILLVQERGGVSTVERPDRGNLEPWIQEYSTGELWWKNLLDGSVSP